jgi:hypothetical protein
VTEAKRDPRIDPRPGDDLETSGIRRIVEERFGPKGGTVGFTQYDFAGCHMCCSQVIRTWRKWAKAAKVLEEGRAPTVGAPTPLESTSAVADYLDDSTASERAQDVAKATGWEEQAEEIPPVACAPPVA